MFEEIVGIGLGINLVNGRLKPNVKFNAKAVAGLIFLFALLLAGIILWPICIARRDEGIIMAPLCIICALWFLSVSPWLQRKKNYVVEITGNTINDIHFYWKGKEVKIDMYTASDGKLAFAEENKKRRDTISFADGSHMSYTQKYRFMNYFGTILGQNGLLSGEVRVRIE